MGIALLRVDPLFIIQGSKLEDQGSCVSMKKWGKNLIHSSYNRTEPLKLQTKNAADDILIFYFYLSKKIRLDFSCESSASRGFT